MKSAYVDSFCTPPEDFITLFHRNTQEEASNYSKQIVVVAVDTTYHKQKEVSSLCRNATETEKKKCTQIVTGKRRNEKEEIEKKKKDKLLYQKRKQAVSNCRFQLRTEKAIKEDLRSSI